jgi:steroid 5-alpha reductase family enzyme
MTVIFVNIGIYLSVVIILSSLLFLVMQAKKDNSLIDIAYGPLFAIAAGITLFLTKNTTLLPLLILAAMTLWSLRLSLRIAKKNWGKGEDIRYQKWRLEWMKKGDVYFILRSFLQINVLQGILIALIATPFVIAISHPHINPIFAAIGGAIFLIGLIIETIADKQIDIFRAKKAAEATTPNILTSGLFKYSRRPNYFGETLIWWGLAVMVLPLPYGWLALLSPLTITYIVTVITGPMLEKIFLEQYGDEYRAYMRKTSYFIPLPPKQ